MWLPLRAPLRASKPLISRTGSSAHTCLRSSSCCHCAGCDPCTHILGSSCGLILNYNPPPLCSEQSAEMGCSSSTQTHPQGANRPPAKAVETNGPKKSASEVTDPIIDDIETIPDQTKLVPLTENEASTDGIPAEEEQVEAEEAIEFEGTETAPTLEDSSEAFLPVDQEPTQAEEPTEVITSLDSSVVEGEIEEAVEANNHEDIVSEEPETKEDETEHSVDAAEPEMDTTDEED